MLDTEYFIFLYISLFTISTLVQLITSSLNVEIFQNQMKFDSMESLLIDISVPSWVYQQYHLLIMKVSCEWVFDLFSQQLFLLSTTFTILIINTYLLFLCNILYYKLVVSFYLCYQCTVLLVCYLVDVTIMPLKEDMQEILESNSLTNTLTFIWLDFYTIQMLLSTMGFVLLKTLPEIVLNFITQFLKISTVLE